MKEEIKEWAEELYNDSKDYLDEYIENNSDEITDLDDYENCIDALDDMFEIRIYDLAVYRTMGTLLNKLQKYKSDE